MNLSRNELMEVLTNRMKTELEAYTEKLSGMKSADAIRYSAEYTSKNDIVEAMIYYPDTLEEDNIRALLRCEHPLEECYRVLSYSQDDYLTKAIDAVAVAAEEVSRGLDAKPRRVDCEFAMLCNIDIGVDEHDGITEDTDRETIRRIAQEKLEDLDPSPFVVAVDSITLVGMTER